MSRINAPDANFDENERPFRKWMHVIVSSSPDIAAAGGLALRDAPAGTLMQRLAAGTSLIAQEEQSAVRTKLGQPDQWLRVQTKNGEIGYIAAWRVHLHTNAKFAKKSTKSATFTLSVLAQKGRSVPLRAKPRTGKIIARLKNRAHIKVIEHRAAAEKKLGQRGQWLHVQATNGQRGYISATALRIVKQAKATTRGLPDLWTWLAHKAAPSAPPPFPPEPDLPVSVQVTDHPEVLAMSGLGLREQPGYGYRLIKRVTAGTVMQSGWPQRDSAAVLGVAGKWLPVRLIDGTLGYCAAWYLKRGPLGWETPSTQPTPTPVNDPTAQILNQRTVIALSAAGEEVRLRVAGDQNAPSAWAVTGGTPLQVLENNADWPQKLGRSDAWVRTQTLSLKTGYVRGTQLRLPQIADTRTRVNDGPLPLGQSAWLYGIHDAFDRNLFNNSGRGWVLFTELVSQNTGNAAYADWSKRGHGVIARLNNDYGGSGTIPTPDKYDAYATQCAEWVRNSPGCSIWVLGNEMNNPREWPNQPPNDPGSNPADEISPENYADCFNLARRAIHQIQPNAIVVPGALDCFQGPRMSCLEWFSRMLARIDDLDGLALHCYTNGYTPELVSSLDTFGGDPLRWQYYHFRGYLPFLDVIPEKWRRKPVYITETDPHGADPWHGDGNGWVQAAYAEIERYNSQPHAQQIQALLLYRWSTDDNYTLQRRPGAQNDIRQTVHSTDYRWRA